MAPGTLSATGKVLSVLASLVMAAVLAVWLGIELGQGITAGVPADQMRPRLVVVALLLVLMHRRPTLLLPHPVWWSSPALAAVSLTWLYLAQAMAGKLGI